MKYLFFKSTHNFKPKRFPVKKIVVGDTINTNEWKFVKSTDIFTHNGIMPLDIYKHKSHEDMEIQVAGGKYIYHLKYKIYKSDLTSLKKEISSRIGKEPKFYHYESSDGKKYISDSYTWNISNLKIQISISAYFGNKLEVIDKYHQELLSKSYSSKSRATVILD